MFLSSKIFGCLVAIFLFATVSFGQKPEPTPATTPLGQKPEATATPSASPSPEEETIIPTFETQKLARTYILDVPAPRGQITDRNGVPLAQNKLSYNLAILFPTPLDFSYPQTLTF